MMGWLFRDKNDGRVAEAEAIAKAAQKERDKAMQDLRKKLDKQRSDAVLNGIEALKADR